MKSCFTKQDSLAVKGIAILMMLWHHCFLAGRFDGYEIAFWPLQTHQAVNLASFCKICVSLFVFISGYGLYHSFSRKRPEVPAGRWTLHRLTRVLSGYWFVLLLSWVVCTLIDGRVFTFYFDKGVLYGLWKMVVEFFGVSNFFGLNPFNGTWWYMSAAVVFVLLAAPAAALLDRQSGLSLCMLGALLGGRLTGQFPGQTSLLTFVLPFCLGMVFCKDHVFERFHALWGERALGRTICYVLCIICFAGGYKLFHALSSDKWWEVKYGLIPAVMLLFAKECVLPLPGIRQALCYLGHHSTNIFLVHTFIHYYYCSDFIYGFGKYSFLLVPLVLLAVSLALSYGVDLLKKLTRYERAMEMLQRTVWEPHKRKEE